MRHFTQIISNIVGKKQQRTLTALDGAADRPTLPNLSEALAPMHQIHAIAEGIWLFFSFEREEANDIKVVLGRMGPQHVEEIMCYFPTSARPSKASCFHSDRAGFSKAKAAGGIVIFPDIANAIRKKRLIRSNGDSNRGSLICFPVRAVDVDDIPYVISVYSPVPNDFIESKRAGYEATLKMFAQRIALEHLVARLLQPTPT